MIFYISLWKVGIHFNSKFLSSHMIRANLLDIALLYPPGSVKSQLTYLTDILNGDPNKLNSDRYLNLQASNLDYNEKYEIDRRNFQICKSLGEGNYGSVYEGFAESLLFPGKRTKVAIKEVKNTGEQGQCHALLCEIKILGTLDMHLNLVNMLGACKSQLVYGNLWLLLEFSPHGDLKRFLSKNQEKLRMSTFNNDGLEERLPIKWAYDIAKGMSYISSKNIMHGDLAARNILIGGLHGQDSYTAKICDFGLSKNFYENSKYKPQKRTKLPWQWMDIESIKTGEFNKKSDIWSFGIVLWEILSFGKEPYFGQDMEKTVSDMISGFRHDLLHIADLQILTRILFILRSSIFLTGIFFLKREISI